MLTKIGDEVGAFVDALIKNKGIVIPPPPVPDFFIRNSADYAEQFIRNVFIKLDPAINEKNFVFIPEYKQLSQYLINTGGKGLLLYGECGTGKSNIIKLLIPLCYQMRDKVVIPVSSYDLNKIEVYNETRSRRLIILDEIGLETNLNDYGEKFNPVERLINLSEDENKALFCSTNLSLEQIFNRYGKRAFDRLSKRTTLIEFKTKSLR